MSNASFPAAVPGTSARQCRAPSRRKLPAEGPRVQESCPAVANDLLPSRMTHSERIVSAMALHLLAWTVVALLLLWTAASASAMPEGVVGDGETDDTEAIQRALDAAGERGGEVYLPAGQYLVGGNLRVPTGVCLRGSWHMPHHGAWDRGSTLLITGGRGEQDAPPTIHLEQSSALKGFTLLWPEQQWDDIVPYPWAIHGQGMHNTVEDVTFVNAYQGISMGAPGWGELHLIRNVFGCVLRRGIQVDGCSDIGRIENVHFNPHYWQRSGHPSIPQDGRDRTMDTARYMMDNLEAFIFGRTDWQYVTNTFVFGARIGYRFISTQAGAANGQFLGVGADACRTCVQVDGIQPIGLQFTNGEFVAFAGDPNTAIVTSPGAVGAAQFVNCNFWGIAGRLAHLQGDMAVTFANCHFVDVPGEGGAILAERGRLNVQGCFFRKPGTAIGLLPGLAAAIITGNMQPGGLNVRNEIGDRAQIALNETAP